MVYQLYSKDTSQVVAALSEHCTVIHLGVCGLYKENNGI